jgi:tRNA (guanine37-N1)-methyltransferase
LRKCFKSVFVCFFMHVGYDIIGNIAILKFDRSAKIKDKKKFAEGFLKKNKSVRTVLEKTGGFSGRLRTHKTKWVAGEKTKEALYKENGCVFRLNVDTCYFSGRLSEERKEIASKVKKNENVLVMFGGVGVYAIVIARHSKAKRVVSAEISRECNKYAKVNVKRNRLQEKLEIVSGDVRKKLSGENCWKECGIDKFDRIVMPRPNLKDSFLDVAFGRIKKGGVIHYYGFYQEKSVAELKELIVSESKKTKKKIKILKVKKAGDVGPYRFRYRVDIKIN